MLKIPRVQPSVCYFIACTTVWTRAAPNHPCWVLICPKFLSVTNYLYPYFTHTYTWAVTTISIPYIAESMLMLHCMPLHLCSQWKFTDRKLNTAWPVGHSFCYIVFTNALQYFTTPLILCSIQTKGHVAYWSFRKSRNLKMRWVHCMFHHYNWICCLGLYYIVGYHLVWSGSRVWKKHKAIPSVVWLLILTWRRLLFADQWCR